MPRDADWLSFLRCRRDYFSISRRPPISIFRRCAEDDFIFFANIFSMPPPMVISSSLDDFLEDDADYRWWNNISFRLPFLFISSFHVDISISRGRRLISPRRGWLTPKYLRRMRMGQPPIYAMMMSWYADVLIISLILKMLPPMMMLMPPMLTPMMIICDWCAISTFRQLMADEAMHWCKHFQRWGRWCADVIISMSMCLLRLLFSYFRLIDFSHDVQRFLSHWWWFLLMMMRCRRLLWTSMKMMWPTMSHADVMSRDDYDWLINVLMSRPIRRRLLPLIIDGDDDFLM